MDGYPLWSKKLPRPPMGSAGGQKSFFDIHFSFTSKHIFFSPQGDNTCYIKNVNIKRSDFYAHGRTYRFRRRTGAQRHHA
jgi:hypothetical protein